ncbi:MAG TPA: SRPBCC domain-containing protein, partial [Ktedonobacteraceae bacterium]|nr:SRPBCC domain-containing protein [Ktedonobacteraceae bacterium]
MAHNLSPHIYEIYIRSTAEQVWQAIIDPDLTEKYYYGGRFQTRLEPGARYHYVNAEGESDIEGTILEVEPQKRLVTTFEPKWFPQTAQEPSKISWVVEDLQTLSLLKLIHENIDDESYEAGQFHRGWLYILSGLKSALETGEGLPQIP